MNTRHPEAFVDWKTVGPAKPKLIWLSNIDTGKLPDAIFPSTRKRLRNIVFYYIQVSFIHNFCFHFKHGSL